jgi:hypothetical protein
MWRWWQGFQSLRLGHSVPFNWEYFSWHQDLTCHICHQDLTVVVRPTKCSDLFFYSCAIISANSRAAIGIVLCQIKVASGFNTYLWGIWHWYHQPYIAMLTEKMWVTFHWSGQLAGGCCRLQDNNWQFVVWRLNWTQPAGYGSPNRNRHFFGEGQADILGPAKQDHQVQKIHAPQVDNP